LILLRLYLLRILRGLSGLADRLRLEDRLLQSAQLFQECHEDPLIQ
jgi:hypothetical protein